MNGSLNYTQVLGLLHERKLSKREAIQHLDSIPCSRDRGPHPEWIVAADMPNACGHCETLFWRDTLVPVGNSLVCTSCYNALTAC